MSFAATACAPWGTPPPPDPNQHANPAPRARTPANHPPPGPNAARNAGARIAEAGLIALTDDDVFAPREWLRALVEGARRHPDAHVFGGPIRGRFEGPAPRS